MFSFFVYATSSFKKMKLWFFVKILYSKGRNATLCIKASVFNGKRNEVFLKIVVRVNELKVFKTRL